MMKKLISIVITAILYGCHTDDICSETISKCICKKTQYNITNCKIFYPNGNIEQEINFKNKKLHGTITKYYENTQISFIMNYIDDIQQGYMLSFYENGDLQYYAYLIDGQEVGKTINYEKDKDIFLVAERENNKLIKIKKYFNNSDDKSLFWKDGIKINH